MGSKNNTLLNFNEYQIIPEAGRAAYFYVSEVLGNYCWQKHSFFPINTLAIIQHKNNEWHVYFATKDSKHFYKILQRFMKNPSLLSKMENYMAKTAETAIEHISSQPLSSLSDKKLGDLLAYYYLQLQNLHIAGMTLRLIDRGALERMIKFFIDRGESDKSNILSSSRRLTSSAKENIALLKLASKVAKGLMKIGSDSCSKELQKIYNEFCSLTLGYYNEPLQTISGYKTRLKSLAAKNPEFALKKNISHLAKAQAERKRILTKAPIEIKMIADIAAEASYLKDYFKSLSNKMQYVAEEIFKEISARKKISIQDLKNLSHQDAIALISKNFKNKPSIVKSYLRHTIFVSLTGKIRERYVGAAADKYEKLFLTHRKNAEGMFKGRTACRGMVKGTAKVVRSPKDFHKVRKGDVIIVMNTSPDYMPIFPLVGAIVAEEGGITAHVSVISREMRVPCIVGIPHITKEIKDGDFVEVDANNGIIKIIK